jgi:hypothetical protein
MAKTIIPKPYTGPTKADIDPISDIVIDLPKGAKKGLRREQPGVAYVLGELAAAVPVYGGEAGITSDMYARITKSTDNLEKIRAIRGVVDKIAEVLDESEAYNEHVREEGLSVVCKAIRANAQSLGPSITAPFQKTLKYNSQAAEKAVRTRARNAAEEAAAESEDEQAEAADNDEADETQNEATTSNTATGGNVSTTIPSGGKTEPALNPA